jgi:L-lactate dehydrogenase (cytochrome)
MMFDFIDGAAGTETGARLNRAAFARLRLQPRVLVNVEERSLATSILGHEMGLPFGIAPMGMSALAWPGADAAMAAGAAERGMPVCVSYAASATLEEMQRRVGRRAWFQLYVGPSEDAAVALADRAAAAGYEVLVLTADVPQVARRVRDLQNGFQVPFRLGPRQIWDFARHPHWSLATLAAGVPRPMNFDGGKAGEGFIRDRGRGGIDWDFLSRLRAQWPGNLIVKGVLAPDDALRIRDAGADAVYVSNHGARQLDSAPPAVEALARIRAAVGPDYPLIFDSGVRNGEDIVKALAMEADFVMLGRTMLYALGAGGAAGLSRLTGILAEEVSTAMAQIGVRTTGEINEGVLAPRFDGETVEDETR